MRRSSRTIWGSIATPAAWSRGVRRAPRLDPAHRTAPSAVAVTLGPLLLLGWLFASSAEAAEVGYVGSAACGGCHAQEAALWKGSYHDRAMQPATSATVLGKFDRARFEKDGVRSTFFTRDGQFVVRTDGPDGQLHDYRIGYTFGVDPLQQYLIDLGDGRLQALGIAWDARPAAEGGQRWFHLYPTERVDHQDVLHWAGPAQNWNFMCAECHSTNLQKGYQADAHRFATTWSDLNVGCEACHGPGARHLEWAAADRAGRAGPDPQRGLTVALRDPGTWRFVPGTPIAQRTAPRASSIELETCGRCHARRAQIAEDSGPGEPLTQAHRLALLDEDLYEADGQIRDEVYEYGSFRQSRMNQAGVTCSDCHDPHSLRLRGEGNAVCTQCHAADHYDGPQHHHHQRRRGLDARRAGTECVSCHMIERRYMAVDLRHDHSFRIPRPDLSQALGTPNACTDCHTERNADWAAAAVATWYGAARAPRWHYGEALHAGRTGRADAEQQLMRAVDDASVPAIARASAAALLASYLGPRSLPSLRRALADPDPLVRRGAAEALAALPAAERQALGLPLLRDPVRTVRLEALAALLDIPRAAFSPAQREALDRAIAEYRQVQAFNADRAEAQVNLGMLESRLGNAAAARAAFAAALRLQPRFIPAYLALADLQLRAGAEANAEATLRRALAVDANAAAARHALGLSLVRQRRYAEALAELRRAANLQPDVPQYAYVYAVALHDTGDPTAAIAALTAAHERRPAARDLIAALIDYEAEGGDFPAAIGWARKLVALTGDPQARALLSRLEAESHRTAP